ncbi:MAG: FAD-dependent oxidoreductase [Verrucomicrobium sp.]|nr:FAD-dependent oxidoreductase [Verrucomicrobium sp.]
MAAGFLHAAPPPPGDPYDVVVYGATPAGVMAAVAAARHGHTVALIEPSNRIGGMIADGLMEADVGDRRTVGGLAAEFLDRVAGYYRKNCGPDSPELAACQGGLRFEPHAGEEVLESMLWEQSSISLFQRLRFQSIAKEERTGRITALILDDLDRGGTRSFAGRVFIDASYEGDLLGATDVPWRAGREGRDEYGEELAGVSVGPDRGHGDDRLMAYGFVPTLTNVEGNRAPFPRPEHYDPAPWRARYAERIRKDGLAGIPELFAAGEARMGPGGKFAADWADLPGGNEGYVRARPQRREEMAAAHRDYCLSLFYFLQNDPGLPPEFHAAMAQWGLARDEFADSGHFPSRFYVREARRMLGRHVLTEQDITQDRYKADGIAEGSGPVDGKPEQVLEVDGRPVDDVTPRIAVAGYDIPYGCMVPADMPGQAPNLLVPVCCSATHVAFCSLRKEPVYMMLGHAAGDAAHLALSNAGRDGLPQPLPRLDPAPLRQLLRDEGAVLDSFYQPSARIVLVPEHPRAGQQVTYRAEIGEPRDPPVVAFWDFDGTGKVAATGLEGKTSFPLEKVYQVGLLILDNAGRRRLVTAQVPVGAARELDATVDECDAARTGPWEGTYPLLSRLPVLLVDAFFGPSIHVAPPLAKESKEPVSRARFQADLPRAGLYGLCVAFRPAEEHASQVVVRVRTAKQMATRTIDERTEGDSPFPWHLIGDFSCAAGPNAIEVSNDAADGGVAADGARWIWRGTGN